MKRWMHLLCVVGLVAPPSACARGARSADPDSLIAALPCVVRSAAPVFANGVRSDSIQVFTWDGSSLFLNGERIFRGRNSEEQPSISSPGGAQSAERIGPRKESGENLAPARLAGNLLIPIFAAIERGRVVFVGEGYYGSFPDVEAALDQVGRALRQEDPEASGPVSVEILRDVIAAARR